jgi:phosphoribosylamine---glycine ligase
LVVKPTIAGLNREAIDYKGFIFVGLMNVGGHPYVIEYNARMGDPETQAVMPRIKNDFVELLVAAASGKLKDKKVEIDDRFAVTIALVSGGYPGDYEKGKSIQGLEKKSDALVFHAGTKKHSLKVLTDGGRVLAITGRGTSLEEARQSAYQSASGIDWEGVYFRKDIGVDLMNYKGV